MAQQLRKTDQEIALLALIDGNSAAIQEQIFTEDANLLAIMLMEWLRGTTHKNAYELYHELRPLSSEQQLLYALNLLQEGNIDLIRADPGWLSHQLRLFKCRLQAAQEYQPMMYDRLITVFASSAVAAPVHIPASTNSTDDLGWHRFSSHPVDLHLLPGYHEALLREPYIRPLAMRLQESIDQAMI